MLALPGSCEGMEYEVNSDNVAKEGLVQLSLLGGQVAAEAVEFLFSKQPKPATKDTLEPRPYVTVHNVHSFLAGSPCFIRPLSDQGCHPGGRDQGRATEVVAP